MNIESLQFIYRQERREQVDLDCPAGLTFVFCDCPLKAMRLVRVLTERLGVIGFMRAFAKILTKKRVYCCLYEKDRILSDGWITIGISRHYEIDPDAVVIGPVWTSEDMRSKGMAVINLRLAMNRMISFKRYIFYVDTSSENFPMQKVIAKLGFGSPVMRMKRVDWVGMLKKR